MSVIKDITEDMLDSTFDYFYQKANALKFQGKLETVLTVEKAYPEIMSNDTMTKIFNMFWAVSVSLLILFIIKKGFYAYVLWKDGDADMPPIRFLERAALAIVVVAMFNPLYAAFTKGFLSLNKSLLAYVDLRDPTDTVETLTEKALYLNNIMYELIRININNETSEESEGWVSFEECEKNFSDTEKEDFNALSAEHQDLIRNAFIERPVNESVLDTLADLGNDDLKKIFEDNAKEVSEKIIYITTSTPYDGGYHSYYAQNMVRKYIWSWDKLPLKQRRMIDAYCWSAENIALIKENPELYINKYAPSNSVAKNILIELVRKIIEFLLEFQFIKTGIQLLVLRLSFPIISTDLLNSNSQNFKEFIFIIVKSSFGAMAQIFIFSIGTTMYFRATSFWNSFVSLMICTTALTMPRLFQQFTIGAGGGEGSSALRNAHSAALTISSIKRIIGGR